MDFNFTATTTLGYQYTPYTDGHAVGYVVTAPGGNRQVILLNPGDETENGFASVDVNISEIVSDGDPTTDEHLDKGDSQSWISLFDDATTADALARDDLRMMSIGDTPTAAEITLRAAEYADRIEHDRDGTKGLDFIAIEHRANHEGYLLDLDRIVQWLRLYGVESEIEQNAGGNTALLNIDGGKVTFGPAWLEFTGTAMNRTWRAWAGTDDSYLTTGEDDPAASISNAGWSELETAWMAINMLTGQSPWQYDGNRRTIAKATPVTSPGTTKQPVSAYPSDAIVIEKATLDEWAGRTLTGAEVIRIAEVAHLSEMPAVIDTIAQAIARADREV